MLQPSSHLRRPVHTLSPPHPSHTPFPPTHAHMNTPLPHPLQGQYPVIREDAAQMCALQMQAEYGPTLASNTSEFDAALEKFMVKQVGERARKGV